MKPIACAFYLFALLASAALSHCQPVRLIPPGEWPAYGRDKASAKYSPLRQINAANVKKLKVAWQWQSPDNARVAKMKPPMWVGRYQCTPILVGGILYASASLGTVAAIQPQSGKTIWTYDACPGRGEPNYTGPPITRGVACWEGTSERRIFVATRDSYLVALNARTGKPIPSFGKKGRIDLAQGLAHPVTLRSVISETSPPTVCGEVIVVGSRVIDTPVKAIPSGDVRGYDVRTGKLLWNFHTIPQQGEFGNETWEKDSWKAAGAANVWATVSYDAELGYVYLPVSTPSNDFYGVERPGSGLFGESLVCLEAKTGKRVWHFQLVHHGLWDYDPPCAPTLLDIQQDGKKRRIVAQVTKQGFCYVFDRVTGEPLWPIEERSVPSSTVPGEQAFPTQPFPTKPAPFDLQGIREEDVMDFTPELRKATLDYLRQFTYGPLFTPPSLDKPLLACPGTVGGASWSGAAADPETGWLYVPSVTLPCVLPLQKPDPRFAQYTSAKYLGDIQYWRGPAGLFITKPPYGRVTAIDLNTGEHVWRAVVGEGPRHDPRLKPLNLPKLGWPARGHILVTKTLIIVCQEQYAMEKETKPGAMPEFYPPAEMPKLRAFDKKTGELLAEVVLPGDPSGAPMTYMAGGKQYIVVAASGSGRKIEFVPGKSPPAFLIALCLP